MLEEKKLRLWFEYQFALKDKKSCEKAIKNGGITAMITASITLVLNVIEFFVAYKKNNMEYELDPWLFFDVPVLVIMGIFVFRKSRISATLLFLYYTISKAIIWYNLGKLPDWGFFIVFLALFLDLPGLLYKESARFWFFYK